MKLMRRAILACLLAGAVAGLSGCATTRLDTHWTNGEITGKKLQGKVLVIAVTHDATMRRLYEDEICRRLAERSIAAVPSYSVLPAALTADTESLLAGARAAGAAAVLSTAVITREQMQKTMPPTWAWRYDVWYEYNWPYTGSDVQKVDRYFSRTSLTDASSGNVLWTARAHSDSPSKLEREVKAFARVIVDALSAAGFL